MATDAAQRLTGRFIDADSLEPVDQDGGCLVEFYMEAEPDQLLSDGGLIDRRHPQVKDIRRLEAESLALLKGQSPFTDEEPQPPAKDASPSAQREYQDAHRDWDERRVAHESELKEKATILRDHHEHKDLLVVSPAGRPIFVDREYIRIIVPGDKDNIVQRRIRQSDVEAYRAKYERFKAGQSQATSGTPIEQMPGMTKSQAKELAYFNVRTVEQLAKLSDANMANIGPYSAVRRKAQDWLAAARGAAPVEEARAETARLRAEIAEMKRQMAALTEGQNEVRRGPGRPKSAPAT